MASCIARDAFTKGAISVEAAKEHGTEILVNNSLIRELQYFVPIEKGKVQWYSCGPTVYDISHMGHARTYLSFDIIRRILMKHFEYDVNYVMNITDVDDKIIFRARRNYLMDQYLKENTDVNKVYTDVSNALKSAISKQQKKVSESEKQVTEAAEQHKGDLQGVLAQEQLKLQQLETNHTSLTSTNKQGLSIAQCMQYGGDSLSGVLDDEQGNKVKDQAIFNSHARHYEDLFFQDMDALGCLRPSIVTRVSDLIPENIQYIQQIMANNMAYEVGGSVYFDTQEFQRGGHTYGKLKPWAVGSAQLASEGESNFESGVKRHPADFALWKAWKEGEPAWESPWGDGRPGWHIECSTVSCIKIGQHIDMHSGGEDLMFPHHDNEQAQCEAYYHKSDCKQWVNYWLHSGHLSIEGLKMSKSLKNFTSIQDALQQYTGNQIRLFFCLSQWDKGMNYSVGGMREARVWEAVFRNCLAKCEVALRSGEEQGEEGEPERALLDLQTTTHSTIHASLCNNFDTPSAITALRDYAKAINAYRTEAQRSRQVHTGTLRSAQQFLSERLGVYGLVFEYGNGVEIAPVMDALVGMRCGLRDAVMGKGAGGEGVEEVVRKGEEALRKVQEEIEGDDKQKETYAPYIDAFQQFCNKIKAIIASGDASQVKQSVLSECDNVRDGTLVELGVKLQDTEQGSEWLTYPREDLIAERQAAEQAAQEKQVTTLNNKLTKVQKEFDKFNKLIKLGSVQDGLKAKYSQFGAETGDPTHDAAGVALEGKAIDKARKDADKERKIRKPLVDRLEKDPMFMEALQKDIDDITAQIQNLKK